MLSTAGDYKNYRPNRNYRPAKPPGPSKPPGEAGNLGRLSHLGRLWRLGGGLMIKIKGDGGGGCYPLWVVVWRTVSADAGGAGGGEEVVEHFGVVAYEEDVVVADALAEEVACGLVEVEAYLGAAEVFVVEVFLEVG